MERVPGERNRYLDPLPHGVGCERCHGPGELHIPGKGASVTIVNPGRLPREQRIHVCFQCHLGDSANTERVLRSDRELESFRPGMLVTEVIVPFRYVEPSAYDFSTGSQADRLMLSRCYAESAGRLECLTCHNPHVTIYVEDRPPSYFRRRCLQCHDRDDCGAGAEARRATAPRDDCVACHMRSGEAADRRHAQFTDHWIRRDIDIEPSERTSFELEPVFPELFAELSPGEQAFYRGRASFLRARVEPPRARPGLWEAAERGFVAAIAAGHDTVDAHFFLGKIHMFQGRHVEAAQSFETALNREPRHHDAAFALGQSLAAQGQVRRAAELFTTMIEWDPDDAMALSSWAAACGPCVSTTARSSCTDERWNSSRGMRICTSIWQRFSPR